MANTELLTFALELAAVAAGELVPRFHACAVARKEDGTVVTEADRVAEREMRQRIRARYPSHGIIGEEEGAIPGREDRQWVIDPLDGTTWFSLGVPKFGTLIALLEEGRPVLGVIHLPITRESVYAEIGGGCWYVRAGGRAETVRVDDTATRLSDAFVSFSGVDGSELRSPTGRWRFAGLLRRAREIEFLGDCLQYTLVARGRFHAAIDSVMQPWDSAAVVPCIREAGGVVSTLDRQYDEVVFGGSLLASSNMRLHEEMLAAINGSG
jgi:histidinol-phosphatase